MPIIPGHNPKGTDLPHPFEIHEKRRKIEAFPITTEEGGRVGEPCRNLPSLRSCCLVKSMEDSLEVEKGSEK